MRHPPPQLSVKTWGGGWRVWGGFGCGGGGLRATHYYHMHTSRGDVCLGVWGYGAMYVIIALSRLCREVSLKDGLMKGKHLSKHHLSKLGGWGWGLGGVEYKDGAGHPPGPVSRAQIRQA